MVRFRRHLPYMGLVCAIWFSPALAKTNPIGSVTSNPESATVLPAAPDSVVNDPYITVLSQTDDGGDSYWRLMFKLGVGLTVVIVLAWGAVFLLRKSSFGQQLGGGSGVIRVKERAFVGPKKAIYLVDIGDYTLAVGVTEAQISLLGQWQPGELQLPPTSGGDSSFGRQFKNMLGQLQSRSAGSDNGES